MADDRIETRHPDPGKAGTRIERWKYDAVRAAILKSVPRRGEGFPFKELKDAVGARLGKDARRRLGSVSWYTTVVKLDLEARGALRRVPGARPQRLLRT